MSNLIVGFITNALALCCAPEGWIGLILSTYCQYYPLDDPHNPTFSRTKDKLRSGEMAISGDQWPVFVYQGYNYDPEDPWNGLLRSTILVSASFHCH